MITPVSELANKAHIREYKFVYREGYRPFEVQLGGTLARPGNPWMYSSQYQTSVNPRENSRICETGGEAKVCLRH
jgi:hypothetical protein